MVLIQLKTYKYHHLLLLNRPSIGGFLMLNRMIQFDTLQNSPGRIHCSQLNQKTFATLGRAVWSNCCWTYCSIVQFWKLKLGCKSRRSLYSLYGVCIVWLLTMKHHETRICRPFKVLEYRHALRGLRSLCDLGVLHPASTLPSILCVTVAGTQVAARHARQLLLRLVENAAPLLAQRCGTALKMAAQQLGEAKEVPGFFLVILKLYGFGFKVILKWWVITSECLLREEMNRARFGNKEPEVNLYSQSWRYGPLCEAYGEFMDTKQARDQFLCSLISEVLTESSEASESSETSVFLLRLQLVVGVLVRLPVSKEAEVARLVHSVVQFLTLKVAPYLTLDDQEKANKIDFPPPTRGTCAVAVVLHKLCVGWLDVLGADFTKQMQNSWGSTFTLSLEPWSVSFFILQLWPM